MNTNTTLTERDKKLLLGLAYVVIAFVFIWCLIRPLCKKIIEVHEDILVASSLRSANETKSIGLASARTSAAKFTEDYSKSIEQYYDYMDSSEIDKLVTSYILEKGLTAKELTIEMPTGYVEETPYAYSDIAEALEREMEIQEAAAQTAADTTPETTTAKTEDTDKNSEDDKGLDHLKDAILAFVTGYGSQQLAVVSNPTEEYSLSMSDVSSTESSGILCVPLTITVEGDQEVEQKIIDELCKNPSVRITGFRWSHLDPVSYLLEDGSIVIIESDATQLTLNVNLYMKDMTED